MPRGRGAGRARPKDGGPGEATAAEEVADRTRLLFEERRRLGEGDGKAVGEVESGEGALGAAGLEGVLRREGRGARRARGKDLAHVVKVLAERVTRPDL